jgi:arsenate reductase (thioredoxin)
MGSAEKRERVFRGRRGALREKLILKKLLFVCVQNSNRSQMAEAFARIHGGENFEAYSAGSQPSGEINSKAIKAMREIGYDLSKHKSKSLDDIPQVEYDFVATMGCGDACPFVRAKRREDWQIPDPKNLRPVDFNKVRDLIDQKVRIALSMIQ